MSTYNNVLGDFNSFPDDLSDADDETDESGSEPEPELGSRSRFNVVSHEHEIDDRSRFVQAIQGMSPFITDYRNKHSSNAASDRSLLSIDSIIDNNNERIFLFIDRSIDRFKRAEGERENSSHR